ncbi:MAG: hypothetical protein NC131_01245 [Roseburia sp.]|nr:hypothetical protein [Roseburia sp.]
MARIKKYGESTTATSEAQKAAARAYYERNKENTKKRGISATLTSSAEREQIQAIFKAHGLTPAQVIRGAAFALLSGEQIPTRSEPLPVQASNEPPTE